MKVVTIGRSKEHNDIVVNDEKVSRNHLQMIMDDNGNYSVQDLNSTNGTFVNGHRISGQVPLKVTDELRIGNTVLSWQCYFGSQPNAGTSNPVPPQVPIPPVPSVSPKQSMMGPPRPKTWLIYVIIGAVVLLLAGGIIGWLIYHDEPTEEPTPTETTPKGVTPATINETEMELLKAQAAADKADKEYAEAKQKAAEAQTEAERLEKIAAQSNSEKDKKAAESARAEANKMQTEAKTAKREKEVAEKKVKDLESQVNRLKEELNQAQKDKAAALQAKEYAEKESKLTTEFFGLLSNLTENQIKQACVDLKFDTKGKKAKEVISVKFKQANNDKKAQINATLKKAKGSTKEETVENDKPGTPPSSKTNPTLNSQPTPSDNSTSTPSSTSQPASTEPQSDSNN